jgi:hypothetical protein
MLARFKTLDAQNNSTINLVEEEYLDDHERDY